MWDDTQGPSVNAIDLVASIHWRVWGQKVMARIVGGVVMQMVETLKLIAIIQKWCSTDPITSISSGPKPIQALSGSPAITVSVLLGVAV